MDSINLNTTPYINTTACTLAPEPNSTYLVHTSNTYIQSPMSGSTMGLMMLLSTFQYQAPYMSPTYSNAAAQAGKAAFIASGGQDFQNKALIKAAAFGKDTGRSIGLNDTEMGIILGAAKVARDKQIDIRGPKIYFIGTHLTAGPNSGIVGLRWSW